MKGSKIKYFVVVLIFWAFGFLAWEWWNSYPRVKLPVLKPESTFEGKVDSILYQAINFDRIPGVSLALIKDGRVVYMKAMGFQNLKTKDSLRIHTLIPVASVSKIFTALSLANHALANNLKISASLNDPGNPPFPNLSLAQLLSHKSGLEAKNSLRTRLIGRSKISLEDWGADFLEKSKFRISESTGYAYSDLNFDLLGYWLENRSAVRFEDLVAVGVFDQAGMGNSFFMEDHGLDTLALSGYQHTFLWKRLEENQLKLKILPSPSSGMWSTTSDMSLALIHLLRGDMGNFQEEMDWLNEPENSSYLGFQKLRMLDSDWIGHFGGAAGYSSFFFFSKNENTGIFLFFNLKDPDAYRIDLAEKILKVLLKP